VEERDVIRHKLLREGVRGRPRVLRVPNSVRAYDLVCVHWRDFTPALQKENLVWLVGCPWCCRLGNVCAWAGAAAAALCELQSQKN
jgi:hypothetical protein